MRNPQTRLSLPSHLTSCSTLLIAAALCNSPAPAATPDPGPGVSAPAKTIPWTQLGAAAGAQYSGDGLTVSRTEQGARLRCMFQRLEGEATREGLWLTSTESDRPKDRFRVIAVEVGRSADFGLRREGATPTPLSQPVILIEPPAESDSGVALRFPPQSKTLPIVGEVSVDAQTVRFIRPGLVEEYSVSMDGVRQDFVVLENPGGASVPASRLAGSLAPPTEGQLRVELAVTGARVETIAGGVQLVLEKSGRKIAYSRLRVTDSTGKELTARMDVAASRQNAAEMEQADSGGLAVIVDDAQAVYPIRIDPTFSDGNWTSIGGIPGADGSVHAAAVDGSGNLYIGGNFTVVGDVAANRIAKWNGSSWSAIGVGMNGPVFALLVSGADVYAGGQFTTAGGSNAVSVAKWNGSHWSALGSGVNGRVRALAISGSDLYAAGEFTTAGDNDAAAFIAKWDGASWYALGSGVNGAAYALAASGSDLYAGGAFTHATNSGGVVVTVNGIAKWNGTNWSALGSGMAGLDITVYALAVSGTNVYAGGAFTIAGGSAMRHIAKWDGSSWSALSSGMPSFGYVFALAVSGNELYAGGRFSATANGTQAKYIAKWNGSSWSALGSGMGDGTSPYVNALAVSGSTVYAGGLFTTAGGTAANRIAKWNGGSWSPLRSGLNSLVYALAVSGSNLYAGGYFTTADGSEVNRIANWDGSGWSALGSGMDGNYVYALAVSGSDLYAGGWFTVAGGSAANYIAKWNGNNWSALGPGMDGYVRALAVSGSDLYAGGNFTKAGGSAANRIAKWNGSGWSALGSGLNGSVLALAVSGSELYAGGSFTTAGGSAAPYIAKWNGSNWTTLGSGMNNYVRALAVSGSDLYAGGDFTAAGGSAASRIAKWNGSSWSALGSGMNGSVLALAVSGSDLYAGGSFTTAGGSAVNRIAKWNGSSWGPLGSGMDDSVDALAVSGCDLFAGGRFTTAGGKFSAFLARAVLGDAPGYNQLSGTLSSRGSMRFSYIGYPATNYALDRAFDLSPPISWVGQQTNTMTISGVLSFTNTPVPGTNNFWRVRAVP